MPGGRGIPPVMSFIFAAITASATWRRQSFSPATTTGTTVLVAVHLPALGSYIYIALKAFVIIN
ncbi:MAG: hypothetical protein VXW25_03830, partial [Pseudomonadota bacterium]|nr:hypothetical protein [Pseudomonadota bacterium]